MPTPVQDIRSTHQRNPSIDPFKQASKSPKCESLCSYGSSAVSNTMTSAVVSQTTGAPAEPVQAELFPHQVGGHSVCARLVEEKLICKPLIKSTREQEFYESRMPAELKPFVPKYFGTRLINISQPCNSDSESGDGDGDDDALSAGDDSLLSSPTHQESPSATQSNPWGRKCYKRLVDKGRGSELLSCIVLEDLTSGMEKPCILDLKVGQRTYSDFASPEKRARAILKAKQTTSYETGLRVCGFQVFDHSADSYVYHDKYKGRDLGVDDLEDTICNFVASCPSARKAALLDDCLRQLHELVDAVSSVNDYRFYSSSLLMVYDATAISEFSSHVIVRMIDFANTSCYVDGGDPRPEEVPRNTPDEGYIFGLNNLLKIMQRLRDATLVPEQA
eukprot:m.30330 g.30330  ORF g.30330 m.30330 type:complete len:390 (+) comp9272_c0_seq1:155-1324(+)